MVNLDDVGGAAKFNTLLPPGPGTTITFERLAAHSASASVDASTLRRYVAILPPEVQGRLESSVGSFAASGKLESRMPADDSHLAGIFSFAGLRVRVPGGPRAMFSLEGVNGTARIVTPAATGSGADITFDHLAAGNCTAAIEAATLRRYLTGLPPEVQGRVETGIANFSTSGKLELGRGTNSNHLAGTLSLVALHARLSGISGTILNLDDLTGTARIDSPLPLGPRTSINIERMAAKRASASVEANSLRRYVVQLPANLHGPIDANFEALDVRDVAGMIRKGFSGNLRLQDFTLRSSAAGQSPFALDRLTTSGWVESQLDRAQPAGIGVRGGTMQWSSLSYGTNALKNLDASWHLANQLLAFDHFAAQILDGHVSGVAQWNLATHEMPQCDLQIKNINMHKALANLAPDRLDAEGTASGWVHGVLGTEGEVAGSASLTFDGPGVLKVGQITQVKQLLVSSFGTDLAELATHDLQNYPFVTGTLYLENKGRNSELKVRFVRQPLTAAEKTPPHKEIINGKELWVTSLVEPKIDLTVPITGRSFSEILAIVSGVSQLTNAVGHKP
jgi:hypothetical protein